MATKQQRLDKMDSLVEKVGAWRGAAADRKPKATLEERTKVHTIYANV